MEITQFNNELNQCVKRYASMDPSTREYITNKELNHADLEAKFFDLIRRYYIQDGESAEKTSLAHERLCQYIQDKGKSLPAYKWLIKELGEKDKEYPVNCCHCVYERLQNNAEHFSQEQPLALMITRAELSVSKAKTRLERIMWQSLYDMLSNIQAYDADTITLFGDKMQKVMRLLPIISSASCLSLFLPEIGMMLGIGFTLAKSGEWMKKKSDDRQRILAKSIQAIGKSSLQLMFCSGMKMLSLNVTAIHTGMGFFKTVLFTDTNPTIQRTNSVLRDYSSLELQLATKPLENYLLLLKNQTGLKWRSGQYKYDLVNNTLNNICRLDKLQVKQTEKNHHIELALRALRDNTELTDSGREAKIAVWQSYQFFTAFHMEPLTVMAPEEEESPDKESEFVNEEMMEASSPSTH